MALFLFPRFFAPALAGALCVLGCGSAPKPAPRDAADANDTGGTVPARNPNEQTILQQLDRLPAGVPRSFGNATVVADAAYTSAASGRTCRALRIGQDKQAARQRLACTEGQAWFFVPDVLGLEAAAQ